MSDFADTVDGMAFKKSTHPILSSLTVAELRFILSSMPDDAIVSIDSSNPGDPILVVDAKA